MKKFQIILCCVMTFGVLKPGIMPGEGLKKSRLITRLQSEHREFKGAMRCLKRDGWKGCTRAEKKRIIGVSGALAALVAVVAGGGSILALRKLQETSEGKVPDFPLQQPGKESERKRTEKSKIILLERFPPHGETVLHIAVRDGDIGEIRELYGKGVDMNVKNDLGQTPLHTAVVTIPRKLEAIKELIAAKANMNIKDNRGRTPLHLAVDYLNGDAIKELQLAGADMNAKNNDGWTPLHVAVEISIFDSSAIDLVKKLLKGGAEVNALTNINSTPLDIVNVYFLRKEREALIKLLRDVGGKTGAELKAAK